MVLRIKNKNKRRTEKKYIYFSDWKRKIKDVQKEKEKNISQIEKIIIKDVQKEKEKNVSQIEKNKNKRRTKRKRK